MVAMSGDAPGGPAGMEVLTRTPGAGWSLDDWTLVR